jgi:hypothetical protein
MISQIMDKAVQHGKNTNSVGVLVFFSPSRWMSEQCIGPKAFHWFVFPAPQHFEHIYTHTHIYIYIYVCVCVYITQFFFPSDNDSIISHPTFTRNHHYTSLFSCFTFFNMLKNLCIHQTYECVHFSHEERNLTHWEMNIHLKVAVPRLYLHSKETLLCLKPTTNTSD